MIGFVPLEMGEFEEWARKQQQKEIMNDEKRKAREECWHIEQEEAIRKLRDGYEDDDEEEEEEMEKSGAGAFVTIDHYKNRSKFAQGKYFCQHKGCTSFKSSPQQSFCTEHIGTASNSYADPELHQALVMPEDHGLVSDAIYLTLRQMIPSALDSEEKKWIAGRGGQVSHQIKARPVGFRGLACKHCSNNCVDRMRWGGRWYPATETAIYAKRLTDQMSKHLMNSCEGCPKEVKDQLKAAEELAQKESSKKEDAMDTIKVVPKKKRKTGNRKLFFHRLWCRVQNIPPGQAEEAAPSYYSSSKKGDQIPHQQGEQKKKITSILSSSKKRKKSHGVDEETKSIGGKKVKICTLQDQASL